MSAKQHMAVLARHCEDAGEELSDGSAQLRISKQRQPRPAARFTGSKAKLPFSHSNRAGKLLVPGSFDSVSVLSLKTPHSKSAGSQNDKSPT